MHFWFVSIFEQTPLDQVFTTRFQLIAAELRNRGHRVTFFASTFKHNTKNQRFDKTTAVQVANDYEVIYVKSASYQGNITPKRLMSHYRFAQDLVEELDRRERPDAILVAFPPVTLADKLTQWAEKKQIPVFVDIIDPWPDIFRKALGPLPGAAKTLAFYPIARRLRPIFKRAHTVIAISNQYLDWARTYYPGIRYTACFYPAVQLAKMQEEIQALRSQLQPDGTFRVIYAGSLASSYDIPTILKAAEILFPKYPGKIEIVIAGVGPQQLLIEEYASRLANIRYTGRLSKEALMQEYAQCQLGLTQHIKGASQSVTYKLFDLLGCGIPVLNSLESEMKDIILSHEVGCFNEPGDAETLAAQIEDFYTHPEKLQQYQNNALELTRAEGDAAVVFARLANRLEAAAARKAYSN